MSAPALKSERDALPAGSETVASAGDMQSIKDTVATPVSDPSVAVNVSSMGRDVIPEVKAILGRIGIALPAGDTDTLDYVSPLPSGDTDREVTSLLDGVNIRSVFDRVILEIKNTGVAPEQLAVIKKLIDARSPTMKTVVTTYIKDETLLKELLKHIDQNMIIIVDNTDQCVAVLDMITTHVTGWEGKIPLDFKVKMEECDISGPKDDDENEDVESFVASLKDAKEHPDKMLLALVSSFKQSLTVAEADYPTLDVGLARLMSTSLQYERIKVSNPDVNIVAGYHSIGDMITACIDAMEEWAEPALPAEPSEPVEPA